jgi:hypothetical protein
MRRERERKRGKQKLEKGGLSTAGLTDLKIGLVERLDEAKDNGTKSPNSQPMWCNTMEEELLLDLLEKKFLEKDVLTMSNIIDALALRGIEIEVEEQEGRTFLTLGRHGPAGLRIEDDEDMSLTHEVDLIVTDLPAMRGPADVSNSRQLRT